MASAARIHVIHENDAWVEPLRAAFHEQGLPFEEWFLDEGTLDLSAPPPEGVFYNRMSASSHTRGHRYAAEYTGCVLAWLESHGRRVVNDSRALRLEISKVAQYEALRAFGVRTPRTVAAAGRRNVVEAARRFEGPFITKHNRAGKGLGVRLFRSIEALRAYVEGPAFEEPVDGVTLVQEYVQAPEPFITRVEFVGGRLLYAVRVDTSLGFELCPADDCAPGDAFCPAAAPATPRFRILEGFDHPLVPRYARFVEANGIGIAGIEFVTDARGEAYTYDVNTNTNYNPAAEAEAGVSGMGAVARYLGQELAARYAGVATAASRGRGARLSGRRGEEGGARSAGEGSAMTRNWGGAGRIGPGWLSAVAALAVVASGPRAAGAYEVWVTDQSDSAKESGGILNVYDGERLAAAPGTAEPAARLDFGAEAGALCRERTGRAPRRPHMLLFTTDQRHALLAFLSGHVLLLDAAKRQPVACVSAGKNVHAAWPAQDGKVVLAANIAEKRLIRLWAEYERGSLSFDPAKDTLDLSALENSDFPDNAPICPITEASGRYAVVTLRGGGLLVADLAATPIEVVARLPRAQVRPAGCGGVQVGRTMYVNSGGGWPAAPLAYEVYALDLAGLPGALSATPVLSREGQVADAHGMAVVGVYLWSVDRAGNRIDVLETATNRLVATVDLAGAVSDDPAPDLIDVAPDGRHVFVGLRGPRPLTGNHPEKMNAKGSTPGVGVVRVTGGGRGGVFEGIARITNPQDGGEAADPHGLAVRR